MGPTLKGNVSTGLSDAFPEGVGGVDQACLDLVAGANVKVGVEGWVKPFFGGDFSATILKQATNIWEVS